MKRLLPEVMIAVWMPFATLFTQPVWCHLQVLWRGAVLCRLTTYQFLITGQKR